MIDRNDKTINLVEIKFYDGVFTISKDYAKKLRQKIQVFLTMITALGLKSNIHSVGLVDNDFMSEVLFVE